MKEFQNPYRNIIHIHIPAFPITMERAVNSGLRGRPVVVATPHSDRAVILSVSQEACKEGIYKGMALSKAIKFCPDLKVLNPNPGLVEKGCKALSKTISQYTPLWEPARPGHVYMDITGTRRLWGEAKDAACRVRQEIETCLSLRGTAGVSGNKMVSSIASRLTGGEKIVDVDHGRESAFMAPLKVDYLPGIGDVRRRMLLEELNITLVREIAVMDVHNLRLVFGKQALIIHRRALGIDPSPVYPPASEPMVSESIILPKDENDDNRILGVIYSLTEKCSRRLRSRGLYPRKAGLMVRYSDQREVSRQIALDGRSHLDYRLYAPLEDLFFKACQRRTGIRAMRIWFRDFSLSPVQLSLFPGKSREDERESRIINALDRIRERHGEEVIRYGRIG